jgi:hypothetical protein
MVATTPRAVVVTRRVIVLFAAAAACAAIVYFGRALMPTDAPGHPLPAQSFGWSDRVPLSRAMLNKWLRERGTTYAAWAKLHPAAAKQLVAETSKTAP